MSHRRHGCESAVIQCARQVGFGGLLLGALLALACSAEDGVTRKSVGDGSGGGSGGSLMLGGGSTSVCDPTAPNSPCGPGAAAPPGCGDGVLTSDEACDDANTADGDGCWGNCLGVDPGYSCNPPGVACHEIARCGDGVVSLSEPCDDANDVDGDGCSAHCKLEIGYKCEGTPSICGPTTCGDSIKEGAESCDDGNTLPFDGCSSNCQAEPNCASGACTSECGDGLIIDEECDDGNVTAGDGCSPDCKVELGFQCAPMTGSCAGTGDGCALTVPAIFRDFSADHSDFGVTCDTPQLGIVENKLSAEGKPVLSADYDKTKTCIDSASSFAEWYSQSPNNYTITSSIKLYDNGSGAFVNQWGPNGEHWTSWTNENWAANTLAECQASGCHPCSWSATTGCSGDLIEYDGNPLFFPVDDTPMPLGDPRVAAKVDPLYGYSYTFEHDVVPGAPDRNFHFTTQVVYWFKYDAGRSMKFEFTGDDDVWVFVNSTLALDLGGLHSPLDGSFTLDSTTASQWGLEDGKVYSFAVFHAERKIEGSSFRLTLEGFDAARSDCTPICGDGIVGLGEECDDGVNDGGYGECNAGCVLGAYCGDGVVQDGEDCDDGNRIDGDQCGSACRVLVVK